MAKLLFGSAYCPSVDQKEGLGSSVEGAGRQGLRLARNDEAEVIVGVGGFTEGESGNCRVFVILRFKQVFQRVKKVTW